MRGVRRQRGCGQGIGKREGRHRRVVARRLRRQAQTAAGRVDDGAGGGGRADGRGPVEPLPARRHHRRWRQFVLHRRHPARRSARGEGDSLRRFGHQRRRFRTRAWILPDDRRRAASRSSISIRFSRRSRRRWIRPRARPAARRSGQHRRARLSALRTERRRPFREDGSQRNRVRDDGGVRGRAEHSAARQHRQAEARGSMRRPRRCAIPSSTSTISISPTSPRSGAAAA